MADRIPGLFVAPPVDFEDPAPVAFEAPAVAFARANPPPVEAQNTYNLPEGQPLQTLLARVFVRQRRNLFKQLNENLVRPVPLPPLEPDAEAIAKAAVPTIRALWDQGGTQAQVELGLEDTWNVKDSNVRMAIGRSALAFAESTNQTTTLGIDDARAQLRRELAAGIYEQGETLGELRKRVQGVFTQATQQRAAMIAQTEASRAVHAGALASYEQSGVVAGVEWLVSSDACKYCQMIAAEARMVRLGERFATIGDHPEYKYIRHPPAHPGCRCSLLCVLTPDQGGPADPAWAAPLDQPDPGRAYTPPPGKTVPEPAPERKAAGTPVRRATDLPEFGPSQAGVTHPDHTEAELLTAARKVFGRKVALGDIASAVGAPDNSQVVVEVGTETGHLRVNLTGDHFTATRTIARSRRKTVITNETFHVDAAHQGQGLGAAVFGRQVEQAARLGVDRIETYAAGDAASKKYRGYDVWPRFGYDGPLPKLVRVRLEKGLIPAPPGPAQAISDLMTSREGRAWWKQHGTGTDMTFDLGEGSLSRQVWDAYRREKTTRATGKG